MERQKIFEKRFRGICNLYIGLKFINLDFELAFMNATTRFLIYSYEIIQKK